MTNSIKDLKFDDKNFNKHTEYGMSLLEKSLQEFGAGRSVLIDKNNRIIAGNGIIEAAGNVGIEDLQIVETDGTKIIAVKRTDVSLDSAQGREMALADNATALADIEWDDENINEMSEEFGFDISDWGVNFEELKIDNSLEEGDLDDETYLTSCYTKKNDIEKIKYDDAVSIDERQEKLKELSNTCENPELKKILERRLLDFMDFNFDYLADYYLSGATENEKKLMVEFGLVIPTEKEAFLNKFLNLERSVILGSSDNGV